MRKQTRHDLSIPYARARRLSDRIGARASKTFRLSRPARTAIETIVVGELLWAIGGRDQQLEAKARRLLRDMDPQATARHNFRRELENVWRRGLATPLKSRRKKSRGRRGGRRKQS